ncbi:MAG: ABC transporter ATP-binding protein [Chloroflexi bacterium OHK40]
MITSGPIIELRGATLRFSDDAGVEELNLTVEPGTIVGLIGPSGSGKTTTVRLLTGVYRPQAGSVRVLGQTPARGNRRLRQQIGYVPQLFTLYPTLTVWENLNFVASLYGMPYLGRRRRLKAVLEFVELSTATQRLGRDLSGGMQRRLSLACALAHDPTLIFADEPTAGIDPVLRTRFWEHFRQLRDAGRTLFVTTQYVGEVANCDQVGVMRDGRLVIMDSPDGLRRRALGGEVVRLVVEPQGSREAAQALLRHPAVSDVRRARDEPGALFVTVEGASEALPVIIRLLGETPGVIVRTAEEYQPPFDDILVTLLRQEEGRHV